MGDYVNHGPDSFGTLKLVKRLKRRGALALAGNHEMRWLNSKDKKIKRWHAFLRELSIDTGAGHHKFLSLIDLTGQYQYSVEVTNIQKMNIKRLKI